MLNIFTGANFLESINPEFSLVQSNALFFIYFIGSFAVLILDVMVQMKRCTPPGIWPLNPITLFFALILLFNLILWVNINHHMKRLSKTKDYATSQTDNGSMDEIVEEVTDPIFILMLTILSRNYPKIRFLLK